VREKNSISFDDNKVKKLLDAEVAKRNTIGEVSLDKLDPIFVAKKYNDPNIALICALFSYGNVQSIVKFLDSLDFSILQKPDEEIKQALQNHYYRFQNSADVAALFIALKRLVKQESLENIFHQHFVKNKSVIDGVNGLINSLNQMHTYKSKGYTFLLGKIATKTKGSGALKRWMMYLRWMIRDDNIDMGLWSDIYKPYLIMPLDTHTFHVSKQLGLLQRKNYDLQAAIELTDKLKTFDSKDPIKYDFALYRIGQEGILSENLETIK
jgi:uncharacterized protein (TIGR02757 family)